MKRQILLTPGPTPLPAEVREALARPIIHHRTTVYQEIFKEVVEALKEVFQTRNDLFIFTSSGTGAMEASIVNFLSPEDKVVVIVSGKFGERFGEICSAYGLNTILLPVTWGEACPPEALSGVLKQSKDVKAVYATLCETSTGVCHDIQRLTQVSHDHGAILVVDAISGLAADPLLTDSWGVDIVVSGSQKALMLPPGLSFISVNAKAWEMAKGARLPKFYFDLLKAKKAWQKFDSPFTPAIPLVVALRETLKRIHKKGMEKIWKECAQLAESTRKSVTRLGLSLFAKAPSNALTAVLVPQGIDGKQLVRTLREKYGIWVAEGQGELAGKIFRIAHMGYIQKKEIDLCLSVLEKEIAYETVGQ
ncbi:MAG: alanine--glyoxylate aminotransferase family protein [Candidatus Omnitrophica bacterium]|nr:alanine--glyoxylate aminotransferase family protein [Candidatus Omnitrophota bacterium]